MQLELTEKEFRRLLDMVYIGNWILNSCRDDDRFEDYDNLEEKLFSLCPEHGMRALVQRWRGHSYPSRAYEEGGIHMSAEQISQDDAEELNARMEEYFAEFEKHGIENVKVEA